MPSTPQNFHVCWLVVNDLLCTDLQYDFVKLHSLNLGPHSNQEVQRVHSSPGGGGDQAARESGGCGEKSWQRWNAAMVPSAELPQVCDSDDHRDSFAHYHTQ